MRIIDPSDPNFDLSKFEFRFEPLPAAQQAELQALAKASFSAADLQKHTEEEEGVSLEDVLNELEEVHRLMQQPCRR